MRNLSEGFEKLKKNEITYREYLQFRSQCVRVIKKLCTRYSMSALVNKPTDKESIINKVFNESLIKTLKKHNKKKGKFSTFFYYKALSSLRVELGKHKRRYKIRNTAPLKEEIYNKEKYVTKHRNSD